MSQDNSIDSVEVKRSYYESGALRCEAPQVNGNMHGMIKEYYPSGALWVETPFVNGYKHGISKEYNREKSSIVRLTLCNRGREVSTLRRKG